MASGTINQQQQWPIGSQFVDAFWDNQYKGVDIVMTRLRKSKDTCEEIKKLYELRANIEQDYGEKLLKLAENSKIGDFEEDSFAETLSRIPSTLETTARAHIDLAQNLKDYLESQLEGFLKGQRDVRKTQQQQIENSKQLKNLHEADVIRARDYYAHECNKLSAMEHYLFNSGNHISTEEASKIEKEIEEQRKMIAVSDQVYKRSVENFNSVNEKWISDWATSLNIFQDMETKRINYLRDTLRTFATMMTTAFSTDEQCCERIRTAVEITDAKKDITNFVKRYGTGTRIPAPLDYEVLYQQPPRAGNNMPSTTISKLMMVPTSSLPTPDQTTGTISPLPPINSFFAQPTNQPLSAPIHQTTLDSLPEPDIIRGSSESNAPKRPITILTNPDEELKSVDRQLEVVHSNHVTEEIEKLVTSPQQFDDNEPLSGVTASNTDNSNGLVSTAMKEVEQMFSQEHNNSSIKESYVVSTHAISKESHDQSESIKSPVSIKKQVEAVDVISNNKSSEKMLSPPHSSSDASNSDNTPREIIVKEESVHKPEDEQRQNPPLILPPVITARTSGVELAPLSAETPILFSPNEHVSPLTQSNDSSNNSIHNNGKYKPMANINFHSNADNNDTSNVLPPETVPNQKPSIGVRTSSLISSSTATKKLNNINSINNKPSSLDRESSDKVESNDYESDEEDKEYHTQMPRPPPKDEKWVISSIRKPQQIPVRTMNAKLYDSNNTPISRNSNLPALEQTLDIQQIYDAGPQQYTPKAHKPINPLTIDIPNVVKPSVSVELPQNAAQQVIADARRRSQLLSLKQSDNSIDRNAVHAHLVQQQSYSSMAAGDSGEDGMVVRPTPWKDMSTDDSIIPPNNINPALINNYRQQSTLSPSSPTSGYYHPPTTSNMSPGPRASSLKLTNSDIQPHYTSTPPPLQEPEQESSKKLFGLSKKEKHYNNEAGTATTRSKENKSRFSLGIFTGNKKEKKKEKEAQAAAQQAALIQAQLAYQQEQNSSSGNGNGSQLQYNNNGSQPQYSHVPQQPQPQSQQQQGSFHGSRPSSHQNMYQLQQQQQDIVVPLDNSINNRNSLNSNNNNQHSHVDEKVLPTSSPQQLQQNTEFICYAKASWVFQANKANLANEMSLHLNELVGIVCKQPDGWWEAERLEDTEGDNGQVHNKGEKGLVPGNYMTEIA